MDQRVRSKTDKILDGLASLLDSIWDDEAPGATEDEPRLQELREALEDIVRTRPGNVVQRLKSLVTRFRKVGNEGHISATHAQRPATSATTLAGRDGHVNFGTKDCEQVRSVRVEGKGLGKGQGKDKGLSVTTPPSGAAADEATWTEVVCRIIASDLRTSRRVEGLLRAAGHARVTGPVRSLPPARSLNS